MGAKISSAVAWAVALAAVALALSDIDPLTTAALAGFVLGSLLSLPLAFVSARASAPLLPSPNSPPPTPSPTPTSPTSTTRFPPHRPVNVPVILRSSAPIILSSSIPSPDQLGKVQIGADLDTLKALIPIVGVSPPTRSTARSLGILSNAELATALDFLAAHGWCSKGSQGAPRSWSPSASPTTFAAWLSSLSPA